MGRGNYDGRKGCPIVKYRDSVLSLYFTRNSFQATWSELYSDDFYNDDISAA